jgi:hypothetical protein
MWNCLGISEVEFVPNDDVPGQDKRACDVIHRLMLTNVELNKFYTAFRDIDADNSCFIRGDEFRAYFKIENTPLNAKLFGSLDSNGNGHLNFMEFVCTLWNFLSMDSNSLAMFSYYLVCEKRDYHTTVNCLQVRQILALIHGSNYRTNNDLKILISDMEEATKPISTADEFIHWTKQHPEVLNPLHRLHFKLRRELIGVEFWIELMAKRNESPEMSDVQYATSLMTEAMRDYEAISEKKRQDEESKKYEEMIKKKRRSLALVLDKIRTTFRKAAPITSETNNKRGVSRPEKKRGRRSFMRPSLVVRNQNAK